MGVAPEFYGDFIFYYLTIFMSYTHRPWLASGRVKQTLAWLILDELLVYKNRQRRTNHFCSFIKKVTGFQRNIFYLAVTLRYQSCNDGAILMDSYCIQQ